MILDDDAAEEVERVAEEGKYKVGRGPSYLGISYPTHASQTKAILHVSSSLCNLFGIENLILMNSTTAGVFTVSCKSGNKNNFFCALFCLLPKFLGTSFAFMNYVLIKAVDRSPSALVI
ncbi:hypothetical protein HS088_TW03G01068 [Tripterygium wilfordii]|uniref:Uncharacterized protein n=1 Tax=Tripterygium wilfordii TaxID=458696 RepID=A0A7J7DWR6_TRIWF|nr:hypothetical protein HS088_TW03G01068 [Tripterygium wilfordii]